jgi:hypothetical protein
LFECRIINPNLSFFILIIINLSPLPLFVEGREREIIIMTLENDELNSLPFLLLFWEGE